MGKLKTALLAGMVAALGAFGSANAAPITGTFTIDVYQGSGSTGHINDPEEQAVLGNPLIAPGNLVGSGTYTGAIDFNDGGQNDIGAFLSSAPGGGVLTGTLPGLAGTALSASGFGLTSVFVIKGDVGSNILFGSLSHDDGASLYDGLGNPIVESGSPTIDIQTLYSNLTGQFQLIYVEANSIPAVLTMDVTRTVTTPEPITLALFGAGLAGLGVARRRRKAA